MCKRRGRMARSKAITQIFRSMKKDSNPNKNRPVNPNNNTPSPNTAKPSSSKQSKWSVYLIISTNPPFKTYLGSTSNFSRRLKQHNGGLSGGAKATRAGKPWVCACLVRGFEDQSEACVFESKWKSISKKLPRKRKKAEEGKPLVDGSLILLQHRLSALNRVKCLIDCTHLDIDWQLSPS